MNLATNQRAQRRDRTNVCMCHLDHLLQLPWAHHQRVPPTEAARQYSTWAGPFELSVPSPGDGECAPEIRHSDR